MPCPFGNPDHVDKNNDGVGYCDSCFADDLLTDFLNSVWEENEMNDGGPACPSNLANYNFSILGRKNDVDKPKIRTFESGATRDSDIDKPDYEGFLSPTVVYRFGEYMAEHRVQADGSIRNSDNWQKGMPLAQYIKSLFRHFVTLWLWHRGGTFTKKEVEDALCGILFNAQGYLHEYLKEQVK